MSIRWKIIEYSRGNNLTWFWRFYRLQKATKLLFFRDIFYSQPERRSPSTAPRKVIQGWF